MSDYQAEKCINLHPMGSVEFLLSELAICDRKQ